MQFLIFVGIRIFRRSDSTILNTHKIKSLLPVVMKKTECAHPDYIKTLGKYQNCSDENKKSMT